MSARLHWFWRALLADVIGSVAIAATAGLYLIPLQMDICYWLEGNLGFGPPIAFAVSLLIVSVPCLGFPAAVYGVLTYYYGPRPAEDNETRCRQCGYILRGILEPCCSECGERI